ncbi:MAG: bacterioferritin-associated ferredoxin [Chromatiales bacterium]|nr:bacterioferritin-associated ferredoxin [Chromatiales bacterium]
MYVCVCNAVTDRQIRRAAARGATTVEDLSRELKVATCCGRCRDCARGVLEEALDAQDVLPIGALAGMAPA